MMPKIRKNDLIACTHFAWLLVNRGGIWYADGRSNPHDVGRHSLGTADKAEALRRLAELDRRRAENLRLIARSVPAVAEVKILSLEEARRLYEKHIVRPRATGGVRKSTAKRYRTTFDKFLLFARRRDLRHGTA